MAGLSSQSRTGTKSRTSVPLSQILQNIYLQEAYPQLEVVFSDEDVSEVFEVLNDSKWSEGVTKTVYNYILELEGNTLYYSFKQGLINDKENFRHLKLSDEEKAYINSIILERIEYKSSSISVQQIDDGFVLVLEKLKNEDAEKILSIWNSGEWEEWFCSDENQEYVFSLSDGET